MNWQLLFCLNIFFYSLAVLFQRAFLKEERSDPVAYAIIVQFVIGAISIPFFLTTGMPQVASVQEIGIRILTAVLAYGIGSVLSFKALKLVEASEYSILIFTKTFWSVILAILLLGEVFTGIQAIGAILIFLSVCLVTLKGYKIKFSKGEIFALSAALLLGFGFINDAVLINQIGFWGFMVSGFLFPSLFISIAIPKSAKVALNLLTSRDYWKPLMMSILYCASAIAVYLALDIGQNPAQLAALSPIVIIVIVAFSAIFLKERENMIKKVIAALLCTAGIFLVS